ncbi:MAG: ferric reductase-like transmembrane domain-containing protein [Actinomycetota bacterium]
MSDQFFWFATRAAGIICWFAAAGSVTVGLLIPTRLLGRKPTVPWLLDLHRYLGAMSVVFLVIHLVTLWFDEFVQFGLADLLVPFAAEVPGLSSWSLATGVFAAWLLLAVEASSLIKKHIPRRAWHTIHLTSFGVLVSGAIHGLTAGSDTDNVLLVAVTVSVTAALLILGAVRATGVLGDRKRRYDEEYEAMTVEERPAEDPFADFVPVGEDGADPYYYGIAQLDEEAPMAAGTRLLERTGEHELPEHRTGEYEYHRVAAERPMPYRTGEHRLPEHRTGEHRLPEHRTNEHRLPEHRTGEHRLPEHRTGEHRLRDRADRTGRGDRVGRADPAGRGDRVRRGDRRPQSDRRPVGDDGEQAAWLRPPPRRP